MLKLAFRSIFRHKVRTGLTLAAIVFGVISLILSGGFVEDVFLQLREATIHSQLGHIQVSKTGYADYGRRSPYKYLFSDVETFDAVAQEWPVVKDVMKRLNFSGLANNGRADLPIIGQGIEPDKEARLGSFLEIIEGRQLRGDDYGALVGKGVARALKLEVGDFMTILGNTTYGAMNSVEVEVVGIFQSFSRDYDDRAVRIPLEAAQALLATDGVHTFVFELTETQHTATVVDHLRANLPADVFEVKAWHELAAFFNKTVDLYRRQFGVLQLIILAMVLLSVANSVNMAIHERTGEFGTLMALGTRRRQVFRLVLTEYTILGVVGAVLGLLLGIGAAFVVSSIGIPMPPPPNSDVGYTAFVRVVPGVLLIAFAVGAIATVFASLLPARRASRLPVVEALRANI